MVVCFSSQVESRTLSVSKPLALKRVIPFKAVARQKVLPWGPGENAAYDVELAGLAGFRAGLVVARPGKIGKAKAIKVRVVGETVSSMASFVPFKEDVVTTIDLRRLRPMSTLSVRETRSKSRVLKTSFGRRVEYRLEKAGKVKTQKRTVSLRLYDPISALFYLRSVPLAVNKGGSLYLAAGTRFYRLDWRVAEKAKEIVAGKAVQLWKIHSQAVQVDGRGRDLKNKKSRHVSLWLSADKNRVPLKLEVDSDFGKATAILKSYRASKEPLSVALASRALSTRRK